MDGAAVSRVGHAGKASTTAVAALAGQILSAAQAHT